MHAGNMHATVYPFYPFPSICSACKGVEYDVAGQSKAKPGLQALVDSCRARQPDLVGQVQTMMAQLEQMSVLWSEEWHIALLDLQVPAVLCRPVLRCAVPCCAVPCSVPRSAVPCRGISPCWTSRYLPYRAVLCHAVLCCAVLRPSISSLKSQKAGDEVKHLVVGGCRSAALFRCYCHSPEAAADSVLGRLPA